MGFGSKVAYSINLVFIKNNRKTISWTGESNELVEPISIRVNTGSNIVVGTIPTEKSKYYSYSIRNTSKANIYIIKKLDNRKFGLD